MNLNELAKEVHELNANWWVDLATGDRIERNKGALLMLVVTELAEAAEGVRKDLMDDKLPHRKMEEVEMADALIRLLDFAGGFGLELEEMQPCFGVKSQDRLECLLLIVSGISSTWEFSDLDSMGTNVSMDIAEIRAYCAHYGLDLEGAMREKLEYNKTRKDHTLEARRAQGGKKL